MVNQVLEGWDTYPVGNANPALNGSPWLTAGGGNPIEVRTTFAANGTRSLYINDGLPATIYHPIPDDNLYCFGFRARCSAFVANGQNAGVGLANDTLSLHIGFDVNARLVLRRSGVTLWTSTVSIPNSTWQYIDAVYNKAAGTFEIYLNNTLLDTVSGIVSIGAISQFKIGGFVFQSTNVNFYVDDCYCNSGDDRYGEIGVIMLAPTADDGGNDWSVVGAASGFAALGNVPENPAQYIEAINVGDISDFTVPALPVGAFQVYAVQERFRAQKTTAGVSDVRGRLVVGGSAFNGATVNLVQGTYTSYNISYDVNPATGVAWAPADFDSANVQIGFERTA